MSDTGFPISFSMQTPAGDDRERRVCNTCGFIDYANPRIVTGVVAHRDGKILLCRRAIEPRKGFWTLPAGFMELGESVEEGACREAREEACADLEIETMLAIYSIPRIGQVQIFFRARLINDPAPGPESLEVGMFPWGGYSVAGACLPIRALGAGPSSCDGRDYRVPPVRQSAGH